MSPPGCGTRGNVLPVEGSGGGETTATWWSVVDPGSARAVVGPCRRGRGGSVIRGCRVDEVLVGSVSPAAFDRRTGGDIHGDPSCIHDSDNGDPSTTLRRSFATSGSRAAEWIILPAQTESPGDPVRSRPDGRIAMPRYRSLIVSGQPASSTPISSSTRSVPRYRSRLRRCVRRREGAAEVCHGRISLASVTSRPGRNRAPDGARSMAGVGGFTRDGEEDPLIELPPLATARSAARQSSNPRILVRR